MINVYAYVGRQGQLSLEGTLPFSRRDEKLLKSLVGRDVAVVARADLPHYECLRPGKLVIYEDTSPKPSRFLKNKSETYYDCDFWILGFGLYGRFSHLVNGHRVFNVVDYDGPADRWFPFDHKTALACR